MTAAAQSRTVMAAWSLRASPSEARVCYSHLARSLATSLDEALGMVRAPSATSQRVSGGEQ